MHRIFPALYLLSILFYFKANSQVTDAFSDSIWYKRNSWSGQIGDFKINEENQLQSIGSANGRSVIYTSYNTSTNQEWQLWCKLNFAPSDANKLRIYLYAEDTSFKNAYYLELGENGNQDAIQFKKSTEGKTTLIAEGNIGAVSKDPTVVRFSISRSEQGNWTINTDYNGGISFSEEFITSDNSIPIKPKALFSIECIYTATRKDKFLFDDLSIDEYVPKETPPRIINIKSDSNLVNIIFDKAIDPVTANDEENYLLSGSLGQPWKARLISDSIVVLNLTKKIIAGTYEVVCKKIADLRGNAAFNLKGSWTHTVNQNINQYEILITEIMADPSPAVGLPAFEYIELLNNGNRNIDLAGIKLFFEKNEYSLDTANLQLKPGENIVICEPAATESLKQYGKTYGLKRMPAIRNTNGTITIKEQDKVIHSVTYDDDWYRDTKKKEGGWSLEMINPNNLCDDKKNWIASADTRGGSPGGQNSAWNPNYIIPLAIDSFTIQSDDKSIDLYVNKKLGGLTGQEINFNPPIKINNLIYTDSTNKINVQLSDKLSSGILYTIAADFKDCTGRSVNPVQLELSKIEPIEKNDLVISEILFNPPGGGTDYIEIYNSSAKTFTTQKLRISNELNQRSVTVANHTYILPGTYYVISSDSEWIKKSYHKVDSNHLIQHSLPSLPDDEGNVSLWSPEGVLIDSFYYNENQHFHLLNTPEGVALERIEINNTSNRSNWHSAAATERYGTPTRKNSVTAPKSVTGEAVFSLQNKTFSPNGDGSEDDLIINYTLPDNGYQAQITIFDDTGRRIKRLYNNVLLSRSGELSWDGKNENDQVALNGIYIVFIEALNLNGKRIQRKLAVVLYR